MLRFEGETWHDDGTPQENPSCVAGSIRLWMVTTETAWENQTFPQSEPLKSDRTVHTGVTALVGCMVQQPPGHASRRRSGLVVFKQMLVTQLCPICENPHVWALPCRHTMTREVSTFFPTNFTSHPALRSYQPPRSSSTTPGHSPPQPTCWLTLSLLLFKRTDYSHDSGSQAHFRWHLLREFFFYPPFIVFTPSPISPFPSLTTSWNHLIITVVCFQRSPPTECMLRGSGPVSSSPILGSPAQCLAYSGHLETNWLSEWMTLHIKKKFRYYAKTVDVKEVSS